MKKDNKRERLFYLDFVRAIAVILILFTHYNAVYVFGVESPQIHKCLFFEYPFGIYIGDLGVSLFLIISGAALMHVYNERIDLKKFYIKRFIAIYPMFWIAYIVAVLPRLESFLRLDINKLRFLLTAIGLDGYFAEYGAGFYVLGEWFLGFIVLFYIIFPLLRYLIKKNEIVTWVVIGVLYVVVLKYYDMNMSITKCIFVRLPELCFGMSFVKRNFKVKKLILPLLILGLIANAITKPPFMTSIQTTYVGVSFFIVLVYISRYLKYNWILRICEFLTKYSYAIFLTHHVIIEYIQAAFDMTNLTVIKNYMLFVIVVTIVLIVSVILQSASDGVCAMCKTYYYNIFRRNTDV